MKLNQQSALASKNQERLLHLLWIMQGINRNNNIKNHTAMKKIYTLMLLGVLALCVSSCGDRYYSERYWGTWGLVAVNEGSGEYDILSVDYEEYSFYDNWRGRYQSNSGVYTNFDYDDYGRGHLVLHHSDGLVEDVYYEFDDGYMLMSSDPSFYTYRVYAPVRLY